MPQTPEVRIKAIKFHALVGTLFCQSNILRWKYEYWVMAHDLLATAQDKCIVEYSKSLGNGEKRKHHSTSTFG